MHSVSIPSYILERVKVRRGRSHVFESIDAHTTALIVVDLQNAFMLPGMPLEIPTAREIVPNVNRIAAALRTAGGKVVWVKMTHDTKINPWTVLFDHISSEQFRACEQQVLTPGHDGHELYAELDVQPSDIIIEKTRFSAFIQGSSELDRLLREAGIDTVIIVGTVTNTCCESTARDAMMLNYKTIFVSDGNAAHTDEEHNATLVNIIRIFGDVRSTSELVEMLT